MSEFPLGQEAALGTVGLYLNTCGEKSNIRVGTESLDIMEYSLLIFVFIF